MSGEILARAAGKNDFVFGGYGVSANYFICRFYRCYKVPPSELTVPVPDPNESCFEPEDKVAFLILNAF
jgi:hypothetical protein